MIALVEAILDLRGADLSQDDFIEEACQILEDISGFENPDSMMEKNMIQRLWIGYSSRSRQNLPECKR